ncbi:MAG: autotransporter-associated beta strand repeat-containing protein [Verrucomicrobiota bacterium]
MNPTHSLRDLAVTLTTALLAAIPTAAPAVTAVVDTSVTLPSPDALPAWGDGNVLYLGQKASNLSITLNSGTLQGGSGVNGPGLYISGGSNNVMTIDGPTTRLIDQSRKNYNNNGAAFRMQGTNTKLIVQNGGYFEEDGYAIIVAPNGEIRVTGSGSVAVLDPFSNDGVQDNSHTTKINVLSGGALYAGSAPINGNGGFANYRGTSASDYAIIVDGSRSVVSTKGFSWYDSSSNGILKATHGGALEVLGRTSFDYQQDSPNDPFMKAVFANIRMDGGTLSYKDVTGVNMNRNQETATTADVMDLTWAGDNAFRLNNSTATDLGTYMLASSTATGTSKNFARLELINGTTSVARALTVNGNRDGAILFDSTTATLTNGVTLTGATATFTASGAPSTLTGGVGGSGSLVKAGSGKLTLNTAPTYSGDTTVNAGTLALALANSNNETSVVTLAAGAMLELAEGVNDTVGTLFFGTALQVSGTWGSSASGATNQSDTYFAGKGTLTVTTGAVVPVIGVEQTAGLPASVLTSGSSSVPFGDVVKGGTKTLTFTLKETGGAVGLTGIGVSVIGSSDYMATGAPTTVAMGTSTTFDVTLAPTTVGAEVPTTLRIASTGISPFNIALTGAGIDGYAAWAETNGLAGSAGSTTDPAFDADPNKDGVKNGLAWILGGNPRGNALARLPHATPDSSGLTLTFKRRSVIGVSHLYLEYGDLAGNWIQVTVPAASGSEVGAAFTISASGEAGFDDVVCVIAKEGNLTRFARLMATEN